MSEVPLFKLTMASFVETLHLYKKNLEWADPLVAHLPLMGSPLLVITIVFSYLLFIFKIGPKLMEKREPFILKEIIMVYNISQILLNTYIVYLAVTFLPEVNIFCVPLGLANIAFGHYVYFCIKLFDIIETIFFVLRKKGNQISFLHVYHHVAMVVLTWMGCNYVPGGQPYYIGLFNGFIHIVMYFYYFLTNWDSAYKSSIWWKRHITELQIIQHCLIFLMLSIALLNPSCTYPKVFLATYVSATLLMIYLFVKFYINTYFKKVKK